MNNQLFNVCHNCGTQTHSLLRFNKVAGVRPCIVTDLDGKTRESLEPVIVDEKDLCYACYVEAVNKYLKPKEAMA